MGTRKSRTRLRYLIVVVVTSMLAMGTVTRAVAETTTYAGSVDASGSSWVTHSVSVDAAGTLTATLSWAGSANLNMGLKNPSGSWVTWAASLTANPEVIVHEVAQTGTWIIGISAKSGAADYDLVVETGGSPPPPPPPDGTFTGSVDASGTSWATHTVEVADPGTITATLSWPGSANLNMGLKDPSGTWVTWATSTTANPEVIVHETSVLGTWTVGVSARSGSASYTLEVATGGATPPPPPPPPSGTATYVTTFGFDGPAGIYPYGVDWDATDDTILVGDLWNFRVFRFGQDGTNPRVVSKDAGPRELGGSHDPFDVEAGPDGTVWVANEAQSRVVQFDHDGNWMKTIGLGGGPDPWQSYGQGCGAGKMHWPSNIAVHPATGNLFVSDGFCGDVSVYSGDGNFLFEFDIDLTEFGVSKPTVRGIDIAPDGKVWLVEHKTRRIFTFDPATGDRLSVSPAQTNMLDPRGLAVSPDGQHVYVVAAFYNQVFKFTTTGQFVTRWFGVGGTDFDSIRYVTVDGSGNVYVGDTWGYRVWKMTSSGAPLPWSYPPQPPPDGGFNQISGIGIDVPNNRLFAVDTFENRAQRFSILDAGGNLSRCRSAADCPAFDLAFGRRESPTPTAPGFNYPRAATFGGGSFWADAGQAIVRFDTNGEFVDRIGQWGSGPGQFKGGPRGIRVVPTGPTTGKIHTTDGGNCRLQILDYQGNQLSTMGSCGGGTNQMRAPWQLDVRGDRAYVADSGRNSILVWDLPSKTLVATYRPTIDGLALSQPRGVVVDPSGQWLYVADTGNVRIVRFALDGSSGQLVTKGAGTPEGFLRWPRYLEFDGAGRLYVSDFNQRIYVFSLT